MKSFIIVTWLFLFFLISGCVSQEIPRGNPLDYELPGINNTTIFYLNSSSIKVVDSIINSTSGKVVIGEGNKNIINPIAIDYSGNNVTFNISKEKNYVQFDFDKPFSGFVAFTNPDEVHLQRKIIKNSSIMVILPVNYTTGFRLLGTSQPEPDHKIIDNLGREVLIWDTPYPEHNLLYVKYYHENSPQNLFYTFIILITVALIVLGYYRRILNKLKKKIEFTEKNVKK